jgi:PTH1 family peptidyl-tRNA hydrolase
VKIIVGLGNPGKEYVRSRHNAGFRVLERFAATSGFPPAARKRQVEVTEMEMHGERVALVKPRSYMNTSGTAVRPYLSNTRIWRLVLEECSDSAASSSDGEGRTPRLCDSLLVIHDDLDLPFGKLRYRRRGSSGGHRGVESLIHALGTSEFSRLKIGIGRRDGADSAEYVLESLASREDRLFDDVASLAARTLPVWIQDGVEVCAHRFNGSSGELSVGSDPASDP